MARIQSFYRTRPYVSETWRRQQSMSNIYLTLQDHLPGCLHEVFSIFKLTIDLFVVQVFAYHVACRGRKKRQRMSSNDAIEQKILHYGLSIFGGTLASCWLASEDALLPCSFRLALRHLHCRCISTQLFASRPSVQSDRYTFLQRHPYSLAADTIYNHDRPYTDHSTQIWPISIFLPYA